MKKIFNERNIVVVLFIAAFVVFSFAQEDAKKIERMQGTVVANPPSIIPSPKQTAEISTLDKPATAEVK